MILIGLDSDDWLDIDKYVFFYVGTWIYDFENLSWLYICLDYSVHTCMSLLILKIMIYLKNLTDHTWHLPDNYIVHITIVAGKILLHSNNTLLLYLLHIMFSWYPDHTCWGCYRDYHQVIPVIKVTCTLNNLDNLNNIIIKQLTLGLKKLMEEIASVFWADLGYELCSRKRVPLQCSRGVTDTLIMFLFLLHVTWLPCGRSWFSVRSLGRGPEYAQDPFKI